jgi:WW domain-binding protein 2
VPGGNIPPTHIAIELKLTFKEGGAPDFHSNLERIKERLQQVVSTARESNLTGSRQDGLGGVNLENVHLDQLPSYQESGRDRIAPEDTEATSATVDSPVAISPIISPVPRRGASPSRDAQGPSDAPPGYEETQQQSIQAELDRRLSQSQG